jgi:tyrosyl-tRNA synthetase
MYGRTMSIPDALLASWVQLLGSGRWDDLRPLGEAIEAGGGDPLALKQALAERIVARFHDVAAAERARGHFRRVVQEKQLPAEVPERSVALAAGVPSAGLLDVMREVLGVPSNAEARRLIAQGAVELDGQRVEDPSLRLAAGAYLLRAGRRRFARIRVGPS